MHIVATVPLLRMQRASEISSVKEDNAKWIGSSERLVLAAASHPFAGRDPAVDDELRAGDV